jgi:hypothetical protein
VVVETAGEHDHVFAESPVVRWSDLDRLAQQYGVPTERIFIDDDARAVLDAAASRSQLGAKVRRAPGMIWIRLTLYGCGEQGSNLRHSGLGPDALAGLSCDLSA